MAGHRGHRFHGSAQVAVATALPGRNADAQHLGLGQSRQHLLRVAVAQIQGLGLGVQPLTQCGVEHVVFSFSTRQRPPAVP